MGGHQYQVNLHPRVVEFMHSIASRRDESIEDAIEKWVIRAFEEFPIEQLSDEELLALADLTMDEEQDSDFSELLALNGERDLTSTERDRLNQLMAAFQHDMLRKAKAMRVAIERGLRPRLEAE